MSDPLNHLGTISYRKPALRCKNSKKQFVKENRTNLEHSWYNSLEIIHYGWVCVLPSLGRSSGTALKHIGISHVEKSFAVHRKICNNLRISTDPSWQRLKIKIKLSNHNVGDIIILAMTAVIWRVFPIFFRVSSNKSLNSKFSSNHNGLLSNVKYKGGRYFQILCPSQKVRITEMAPFFCCVQIQKIVLFSDF